MLPHPRHVLPFPLLPAMMVGPVVLAAPGGAVLERSGTLGSVHDGTISPGGRPQPVSMSPECFPLQSAVHVPS